jgi:hypothetical protein
MPFDSGVKDRGYVWVFACPLRLPEDGNIGRWWSLRWIEETGRVVCGRKLFEEEDVLGGRLLFGNTALRNSTRAFSVII